MSIGPPAIVGASSAVRSSKAWAQLNAKVRYAWPSWEWVLTTAGRTQAARAPRLSRFLTGHRLRRRGQRISDNRREFRRCQRPGSGLGSRCSARVGLPVSRVGSAGIEVSGGAAKLNAFVRSPVCERRQRLRLGTSGPKRVSRNRSSEVWSKVFEHTKPPRENGEITSIGTRKPNPIGPRMPPAMLGRGSTVRYSPGVPGGGTGGGTWSKKPPFSS